MSDDELDQLLQELQGEDLDDMEYDFLTEEEVSAIKDTESWCEVEQCDSLDCLLCEVEPEIEG